MLGGKNGECLIKCGLVSGLMSQLSEGLEFRVIVEIVIIEGEHQILVAEYAQGVLFVSGVDLIAALEFADHILALLHIELGAQIHVIEQNGDDQHEAGDQNAGKGGGGDEIAVNGQASAQAQR